ncbi:hypothetical protein [Novipirellula artificiosorum]|uniref:Uncharacterized protein n=1 Tax=Novipirellula artificiosorum TaxID=2528016 RepID=A0A5C6DK06_9BACT|nr:hypothetical protein [Novipirellula artificiosorum]TWU37170.1 hypothetical protein Poly41_32970 [Novipirellula artificiosorum]
MVRKLTHYLTALAALAVIAIVYQVLVVSWLRPPKIEAMAMAPRTELHADDTLGDLFPVGAWQRGKCKRLQTASGMLLFENLLQVSPDQWKLSPMTIVIGRGINGDSSGSPVVIESREGAEIRFTGSLDPMSGSAPPIKRGLIKGVVQISRLDPENPADSLYIRTANVEIDNQTIRTFEAIQMNLGRAKLIGRDLTIHLATAASSPMMQTESAALLDRMELIYLEELTLPLEGGGLWPATTSSAEASPNELNPQAGFYASKVAMQPAAVVNVECSGRVEYDFAINQLMLRNHVAMIHQIRGAATDRFDCDTVELTFRDPNNKEIPRNGPLDWITRVKATGAPLVADLPNLDLRLAAGQIDLQANRGLLRADGNQGIDVRRGGIHARLESIVYQYDPSSPETLGAIDARGLGIVQIEDPELPLRRIQWKDSFALRPLSATTAKSLDARFQMWIDGDVKTTLSDGGQFNANAIQGVLKPDPSSAPLASDPNSRRTLVPESLSASGLVHLDTAALAADTDELRLFFVDPDPSDLAMVDQSNPNQPATIRQLVAQPSTNSPTLVPGARQQPKVRGNVISAKLLLSDEGIQAKDLSVRGSVELIHTVQLGGQPMMAKLTGEELRLIDGGGEDVLHLGSGVDSPARIELGDGYFVGPVIQIRPSDNVVWINEAGELRIPSQALPNGLATDGFSGTASAMQFTSPPLCRWQGEMIFDGKKAVLTDGVEIEASLIHGRDPWRIAVDGDRMEILLDDGVEVRDLKTMRNATIQRIELTQSDSRPLLVEAIQHAADGLTEARHLLHAETLKLFPMTGEKLQAAKNANGASGSNRSAGAKLIGTGPGWYRCWTRGSLAESMPGKTATADPNDPTLSSIHLVFHDAMQADLANQTLDFFRGVRVGVRDVTSWDETFDAQTMDALSTGQSTLDCDQLKFAISPENQNQPRIPGLPARWEAQATGGVVFRNRSDRGLFECTATRAAYASGKELFTMHGAPNRPALYRHQPANGQPGMEGAVRTMTLNTKTMELENLQLEGVRMAAPPGMNPR